MIACVAAALIAMQVYFKRGMQGRLRQTADSIGSEYSPKNTIGSTTLTYKSKVQTIVRTIDKDLNNNGIIEDNEKGLTETTSNLIEGENIQNISGSENVGPLEPSLF